MQMENQQTTFYFVLNFYKNVQIFFLILILWIIIITF